MTLIQMLLKKSNNPAWRVFCAIELPQEVSSRATEHINRLRQRFPDINASWNRNGKFHLTLKFLGEISQTRVADLSRAAAFAVGKVSPFEIIVEGAGAFPVHGPPKVLWIGISDPAKELDQLYQHLESESAKEGFAKEPRPFHPHLTLARLRKPQGARSLACAHQEMVFEPIEISVSELLVIRSELSSEGSKHSVISRHRLGAQASLPAVSARRQKS
jgi:2'-5' RNA ligase